MNLDIELVSKTLCMCQELLNFPKPPSLATCESWLFLMQHNRVEAREFEQAAKAHIQNSPNFPTPADFLSTIKASRALPDFELTPTALPQRATEDHPAIRYNPLIDFNLSDDSASKRYMAVIHGGDPNTPKNERPSPKNHGSEHSRVTKDFHRARCKKMLATFDEIDAGRGTTPSPFQQILRGLIESAANREQPPTPEQFR